MYILYAIASTNEKHNLISSWPICRHLFKPSLVQSLDQILFMFQGNSLLLLERESPRLRIPSFYSISELFMLEEAVRKVRSLFHSRCDTQLKRVKVELSVIEFNMFPINIFKISDKKHAFMLLALIFVKKDNLFSIFSIYYIMIILNWQIFQPHSKF